MREAALQSSTMRLGFFSVLIRARAALVFSFAERGLESGDRRVENRRWEREAWRRREIRDIVGER